MLVNKRANSALLGKKSEGDTTDINRSLRGWYIMWTIFHGRVPMQTPFSVVACGIALVILSRKFSLSHATKENIHQII